MRHCNAPRRLTWRPRLHTGAAGAVALAVLALVAAPAVAQETARQILDRAKALDDTERHWTDRYQRMQMQIHGGQGKRERDLEVYERKYSDGLQKAIVFLRAPAEVKDIGFLAFTPKGRSAEQWLYLPTYKRVRKITAAARGERFVGTDLTYRDLDTLSGMISWTESEARSTLLSAESVDGTPCHVLELAPQRADIEYKRLVVWLGRDDLVPRQVELYETAGAGWWSKLTGGGRSETPPHKRVRQHDIQTVGAIPVARKIEVETPAAGTRTLISVVEVKFNQNLPDELFTQQTLQRGHKQ